jgi:NAD+ kinase
MTQIGIVVKAHSPRGQKVLSELVPWLKERGKEVVQIHSPERCENVPPIDMIIVLGGDGTLLSAARLVEGTEIPILGVNLGSLGFLTEVTLNELYPVLEDVLNEKFAVHERLMLKSTVHRGSQRFPQPAALNDVVINSGTLPKMIRMEIYVNGQFVTHLRADGLIIASPTGSTAYSLSSGGPIAHPSVDAILLTPISPHMLTNRPIVISSREKVEVLIQTEEPGPMVTYDGQVAFPLQKGDVIEVTESEKRLKLIVSPQRNYYQILREKLKWGEG